ncbi:MAG: Hsp33 family molecular chaperone HslO [Gammaproteobacteria bacterium]
MQQDCLQRFIFEHSDVRGEILRLNKSFKTITEQHYYPTLIRQLLGEALTTSILLTATIKFSGNLTLQFQTNNDRPVKLLVARCDQNFNIRGLVQFNESLLKDIKTSTALLGEGQLVVTISPDNSVQPYQSIIPLHDQGIAQSLENYFAQSEQLATRIWLASSENSCAGILLQLLPEKASREREFFWEHAVRIGETITPEELLTLPSETILHRLYHDQDIRLFDTQPIQFKCHCSKKGMENAIRTLGEQEAMLLIDEKQCITVTCEFCNSYYNFDKVDVANIFHHT